MCMVSKYGRGSLEVFESHLELYTGTFLHSKLGSGHLAHGGHGGGFSHLPHVFTTSGHLGHTGGTICDFNILSESF